MPSDLSSWSALEARLTVDESAIRSIVKIKMRNKKRRAYNLTTYLPIVLPEIGMFDYLAASGGITW
jgi:hypothetical protein